MGYTSYKELASGIADVVKATEKFRQVLYTQATNGAQLWAKIESLTALPGAVVAIGESEFADRGLCRTVRPMVFVVSPFNRGMEQEAGGVWELLEAVESAFYPDETLGEGIFKTVCGIEFHLESIAPIESPEKVSACCLILCGIEFMQQEPTEEN